MDPTNADPDADPSFFKDKVIKKSQNSRNYGFSYYFNIFA
jgi:GT2 family glycosyltransferase